MKPMLASDYVKEKVRFPIIAQPKIDGVRGWNPYGNMVGRSLKPHGNLHTAKMFSDPSFKGLDGELAAESEVHPRLCSLTSSATSTIGGEPFLLWHCFDYVTERTIAMPYEERYAALINVVNTLGGHLRIVPSYSCKDMVQLEAVDEQFLILGFEGTIIRDPKGLHKQGRSTVREGGLLRIKHFIEEEAIVIGLTEGNRNDNEAQINELGRQFRTSHQENKIPNGMLGSMQCRILKTTELFKAGDEITVSPGVMTKEEKIYYWENQNLLINQIIKFKHFAHGVKDKPRFPNFQSIRGKNDIGI
jgi:DNA ligase-1